MKAVPPSIASATRSLRRTCILLVIGCTVSACGGLPTYRSQPCFDAFATHFKPMLGDDVIDCGVVESAAHGRLTLRCAEAARAAHRRYWLGYTASGEEGFMCWAVGEDAQGQIWQWWLDRMVTEDRLTLEVKKCTSLELRGGLPNFEAAGCARDEEATRAAIAHWK